MEPDHDHLWPTPAAPDALRLALDEARAVRHAINQALFQATQAYRDALASRPLDAVRLARTCGEMRRLEFAWVEQAERCWSLRERWEGRWRRTDDVAEPEAA
jgi:hypothetical protein